MAGMCGRYVRTAAKKAIVKQVCSNRFTERIGLMPSLRMPRRITSEKPTCRDLSWRWRTVG